MKETFRGIVIISKDHVEELPASSIEKVCLHPGGSGAPKILELRLICGSTLYFNMDNPTFSVRAVGHHL